MRAKLSPGGLNQDQVRDLRSMRRQLLKMGDDAMKAYLTQLPEETASRLFYTWEFWARDKQIAPIDHKWHTWICLPGRAWGKTRTGAETVIGWAQANPGTRIALIAKNPADWKKVMIEGESGILSRCPPWFTPRWNSTQGELKFPNKSLMLCYSAETPDALRGPQHHYGWIDEWCKFKYPREVWDQYNYGLRLGEHPRTIITTTPRPLDVLLEVMNDPTTRTTTGALYENEENLPDKYLARMRDRWEGTTLGRQEIYGEILAGIEGVLWQRGSLDTNRVRKLPDGVEIVRMILAVDPSMTSDAESDETGIVIAGLGDDNQGYVFEDLTAPGALTKHAAMIVNKWQTGAVDMVVAERNNGGELVEATLRNIRDAGDHKVGEALPYKSVVATRGKRVRAEPVAMLYDQAKVHHVGILGDLEDELVTWLPENTKSPNRMDALVWALTELMVDSTPEYRVRTLS